MSSENEDGEPVNPREEEKEISKLYRQPKSEWNEELLYQISEVADFERSAKEERDEIGDHLEALRKQQEQSPDISQQEVESLKSELEQYQQSVPLPVYAVLLFGALFTIYSLFLMPSLVFLMTGVGLMIISIVAIIESKINRGRRK